MSRARRVAVRLVGGLATAALAGLPAPGSPAGRPGPAAHTCGGPVSLSARIASLPPGTTLAVSGTCSEAVSIGHGAVDLTIDGQGSATLLGPGSEATLTIRGRAIVIRGFTIQGGGGVDILDGAVVELDGNTIQEATSGGVNVLRASTALLVNNLIRANSGSGVYVAESATARIGFRNPEDLAASPNTIEGNAPDGIVVIRAASARIVGNRIRNNTGNGVSVARSSQADLADNDIDGNGTNGIALGTGAMVQLGRNSGNGLLDRPNRTDPTSLNGNLGLSCSLLGVAAGRRGTLSGTAGPEDFPPPGCVNGLPPP